MLKVLNDIITAIDRRQYCAAVFIDLAKAFDSVNHHILIGRLNSLGFLNDCLAWFPNYFSDRVQCGKSTIPVFYLLYCIYYATMAFFLPLPPLSHLICSHCI